MHTRSGATEAYSAALQDMTRRYERVVLTLSILSKLNAIDDPYEPLDCLFRQIVETIASELTCENCSIMICVPAGNELELRAACSPLEDDAVEFAPHSWRGKRFRFGEGVVGKVAASGQSMRVADTLADEEFVQSDTTQVKARSLLCFPLKVDQSVFGVLNLSHSQPDFFTIESEKAMELIADRCSRMIQSRLQSSLLRESEEYHRLIAQNAADGIVVFSLNGTVLTVNPAVETLTGFSVDEWLSGKLKWIDQVHAEDRDAFRRYVDTLSSREEPTTLVYRFVRSDGSVVEFDQRSAPLGHQSYGRRGHVSIVRERAEPARET